jgi:uncharacterized membrane protein YecN with MAPEG domain
MLLPITLTISGAAALLNIWLGQRVGKMRILHKVSIGDGGNAPLTTRMRAQANFVEYTPFFLILLGLIELAIGSETWLWIVAIVYILGRIVHMFGMDHPPPSRLRLAGIIVTLLCLLGLALYAIALPYLKARPTITYVSSATPGESPGGTKPS